MNYEPMSGLRIHSMDERIGHLERQMIAVEKALQTICEHLCTERDDLVSVINALQNEDSVYAQPQNEEPDST